MLGQREEQKQRTRARILAAARKLFADPGYEATTIRMIAAEAGVAAGSVFTTFESKEDVLFAISTEMFDEIAMRVAARLSATRGSAREKVKLFFCEMIAAMEHRLPLMMVHFGLSWRWSHEIESERPSHVGKLFQAAHALLKDGVASGEIAPDTDIQLLGEVLADICVRNIRRTWYRRLDGESLAVVAGRQVDLVFDGAARRDA
jgi:TetR/AcrR family transcriptional regulator, cholesterol catabolism regulator